MRRSKFDTAVARLFPQGGKGVKVITKQGKGNLRMLDDVAAPAEPPTTSKGGSRKAAVKR